MRDGRSLGVGWQRCLAKDSMVLRPDGTETPIQDLVVGDEVLAFDFKTEELVPTKVVDTFVGYARNMVTVGISDCQTITCTDDRPFAHRATPKEKIKFKKVREIKDRIREFQSVVLPSKWNPANQKEICSPEMARIIGYLLGDDVVRVIDNITKFTGGHFPTMYISNFSIWTDKITFHFVKWEIIKLEALIYLHPKHFTNSWLAHVGLLHIRYRKYFFRLRVLKLYRHFLYCFFVYQNELFLYSFLFIY